MASLESIPHNNTTLSQFTGNFHPTFGTSKVYSTNIFSKDCRFSHYGKKRRAWEYIVLLCSILTIIEITFVFIVYPEITFPQYLPFFLIDIVHAFDYYVITHTIFITNGEIIGDTDIIKQLYGRTALWIDLASIIPLGWIGVAAKSSIAYLVLSLNKLLRLYRGWRAFRTTRTQLPYIGSVLTILPFFFVLLFTIHIFSCILILTASAEGIEDSWAGPYYLQDYSRLQLYVVGFYFVLTTVSTIGYGDIVPKTNTEIIVMIFVQIIGVLMHAFITSNMVYVFFNPLESDFINQYKVSQDYLKFKKVDMDKRKEVRNFCQYYWETTGAAGGIRNILKNLPKSLRTNIKLELTNNFFTSTVSFSSLSKGQLAKIAKIIKHVTFSPGSYLYTQGELCNCMLFVGRGITQIIADGQVIATMASNETTVHGENQMLLGSQCATSIRALTYVDAWVLYKDDLSNLMRHRGYIRNLMMQSIAVAFPVVIDDIAKNMLGEEMAQKMLKKLRANPGEVFKERIPTMNTKSTIPRLSGFSRGSIHITGGEAEALLGQEKEKEKAKELVDQQNPLSNQTMDQPPDNTNNSILFNDNKQGKSDSDDNATNPNGDDVIL